MNHLECSNLDLRECNVIVLDKADEMLNMGFVEDVKVILEGAGSANNKKMKCLPFSAMTPPWVKEIRSRYQKNSLCMMLWEIRQAHALQPWSVTQQSSSIWTGCKTGNPRRHRRHRNLEGCVIILAISKEFVFTN
jgi:superfamily II DNA/RNA helicase